jgi:hypothetical protein
MDQEAESADQDSPPPGGGETGSRTGNFSQYYLNAANLKIVKRENFYSK